MILKIIRYIRGSVTLCVKGFFIEKFLNLCAEKNIFIWDISHKKNNTVMLKMSINGFKKIRNTAYKTRSEIKIIQKSGLPFVLENGKSRKGLFAGAFLAVLIFFALSSFVWEISVEGNEKMSEEKIISLLSECGFKIGTPRWKIDANEIKNKMLLKSDALSWIWVDVRGTRAVATVREKKEAPKIYDESAASNIVAKRNGLITGIAATNGIAVVKEGDVVAKGDLLISGVSESSVSGYKYINSSGTVKARTWYENEGQTSLVKTNFSKTSKKISKNTVNFFGFDVLLYWNDKIPFKFYEEETKNHRLRIGKNAPLPVEIKRKIYYELEKKETKISLEDAVKAEGDSLKKELDKTIGEEVSIVKKDVEFNEGENGTINVKVIYECIEDIAENVPIDTQGGS